MTNTEQPSHFVARFLPWLVAIAALIVYSLTLNHWASLFNLAYVAKASGWMWQPELTNPLLFLVMLPFHLLPTTAVPFALNFFSVVCAALTLGLLARSVALLPYDRTRPQREREHSAFSVLTIPTAWLPPVFAALVCGLQMTFWEHATNFSGEMFELLLFAFVVWSLLEYRIDGREWRLFLVSFIYGAAMTDNWAMIGFFPLFIAAIIWIRGWTFFNFSFLSRMALCGIIGLLLYFLLPTLTIFSAKMPVSFWLALKYNLTAQFQFIKLFFLGPKVRIAVGLLSLTSLLPVVALAIRWKSSFGDTNRFGAALAGFAFHIIYAAFLLVCVWVAFDPPFSPRNLFVHQIGFPLPFLTFYYLAALSIGYFSGYFLLIFGTKSHLQKKRNQSLPIQNYAVVSAVWLWFAIAVAGLVCKNLPQIRATNGDLLHRYASLVEKNLPDKGAILLSDDWQRLSLVQEVLVGDGREKNFIPVDTRFLVSPYYHQFLHKKYPLKFPDTVSAYEKTNVIGDLHLMALMASLSKTNEIYYLHPSFGYYSEEFYLEPHGAVYKLKTLPEKTLLPPPPDKNLIAENERFWADAKMSALTPVEKALASPDAAAPVSWQNKLFARFHISREQNPNAIVAGAFYSHDLDFWGVKLQRAGELPDAAAHFESALKLNPDNVVAQINLDFNKTLQAGKTAPLDLSKTTTDQLGKYRTWEEVLNANGPFDEPSFCFEDGVILTRGNLMREAIAEFARVRELLPDNLPTRLMLGELYVANHRPDQALRETREIRAEPEKFSLTATNEPQVTLIEAGAEMEKTNFARGTRLIESEISRDPTNNLLLAAAVQLYMSHGLFTNALTVIQRKLQSAPNEANWLFMKGYIDIQVKNYDDAVSALSRVILTQTNNVMARFDRAIAYLDSGKLDNARADYETLSQTFTNSYQVDYGLGEIAYRKHETNDAIKYYQLYLNVANTNAAEAQTVAGRLRELKK